MLFDIKLYSALNLFIDIVQTYYKHCSNMLNSLTAVENKQTTN